MHVSSLSRRSGWWRHRNGTQTVRYDYTTHRTAASLMNRVITNERTDEEPSSMCLQVRRPWRRPGERGVFAWWRWKEAGSIHRCKWRKLTYLLTCLVFSSVLCLSPAVLSLKEKLPLECPSSTWATPSWAAGSSDWPTPWPTRASCSSGTSTHWNYFLKMLKPDWEINNNLL